MTDPYIDLTDHGFLPGDKVIWHGLELEFCGVQKYILGRDTLIVARLRSKTGRILKAPFDEIKHADIYKSFEPWSAPSDVEPI